MMPVPITLVAAGFVLLACAAVGRTDMVPARAARLVMASLLAAAAFIYLALALVAGPLLLAVLPSSALSEVCRRELAQLAHGGPVQVLLAAAIVLASMCAVAARMRRCLRERGGLRVEPEIGSHEQRREFDLVTLPCDRPVAYSLGGRRSQVVISRGLRDRLDEPGLAAVVAHEAAHLRARHDRWLVLAALLETALWFVPWAERATSALRLHLERWADEHAARTVGRGAVRAGLLAAVDAVPLPRTAAALSPAAALAERLAMLSEEPPEPGARLGRFTALTVGSVAASGGLVAFLAVLAHMCTAGLG
jgi:Zn-dependent protease with chaperone function